jgi:hypothetical protein
MNTSASAGRMKGLIWVAVAIAVVGSIIAFAPVISHLG